MEKFYKRPSEEIIWRVDVSDEYLTFTVEERPIDFEAQARVSELDDELSGTYCGDRGFEDETFQLVRRLRAKDFYKSNFKDKYGNFSLYEWRTAHGYGYAWNPSTFWEYKGKLYTTHINFL